MELDLPTPAQPRRYAHKRGHAARPGDGPAGETCGSCAHAYRFLGRPWTKCRLVEKPSKTRNGDIRLRDPACELWKGKDDER